MAYLLGIDYGTGGAKAALIDLDGNVLSYAFEEYPIIKHKQDWSEHDANLYWEIACRIISKIIMKANVDPEEIKGIGTSSALPSMVLIDKDGCPINNAYNLMDRRARNEVQWLKDYIGENNIFDISGNRLDDHPLVVNILWEKNNRPEGYKKIYKALTIDGYIRYKLTGITSMNYSAGSFYGVAYDIRKLKFDNKLLNKIGVNPEFMPEGYACEEIIGTVTKKAAKETGLTPGIPVPGGQVDCNAAWVGAGAINIGDIQMNLGTCGNFGIIHQNDNLMNTMINFPYTVDSQDTFITAATTTTGGQSIRYIRDNFSPIELQIEKIIDVDSYDLLNLEARKIKPGSDGLIILPFLQGERTPIWDVNARGLVFGLSLSHGKGHLVRAMMEGVAYALYDSLRLVKEAGLKVNYPIVLNEGGAKSILWRRIITDVFNAPTVLVKNRTGAPYGDAILAGVATGLFEDFSIAKKWVEHIDLMEPDQETHKLYMDYFKIYKNIYEHVKNDYKDLAFLRKKY